MKALRLFAAATALPLLLLPGPALAVSHKEKLATCDFGAKDQKLTGAKRKHFIARCMANENYKPKAEQMKLPEAKPAPKKQ